MVKTIFCYLVPNLSYKGGSLFQLNVDRLYCFTISPRRQIQNLLPHQHSSCQTQRQSDKMYGLPPTTGSGKQHSQNVQFRDKSFPMFLQAAAPPLSPSIKTHNMPFCHCSQQEGQLLDYQILLGSYCLST